MERKSELRKEKCVKLTEKDKEFVEKRNCQEQSESTLKKKHPVIKTKH